MADKTFVSIVPRLYPHVPGCPQETARQYIRDAARNVCERTLAWRYHIPLFDLLPGVHEYAYDVPSNTEVTAVFAVLVNGQPLSLLNLDEAIAAYPNWADLYSGESFSEVWSETPSAAFNDYTYDEETLDGLTDFVLPDSVVADAACPAAMTQLTPSRFIILPLPDGQTTYTTRMIVALKPRRSATGMDEDMLNELEDVIIHRAVQNLTAIPNTPWFDKEVSGYHAKQYQFHMNERRARANLGSNRGSMTTRMQRWA